MGTDTFQWIQSADSLEQSRSIRFRTEMRPILLNYFGLAPGMDVLEVGCGPDTLASYLAEGIAPGKVTGVDLDSELILKARARAEQRTTSNVSFVVGDAYHLPFENDQFDAVISYTGIGVLTNPEVAVHEMLRVCRPGGTVSIAEAVTGRLGINFLGIDSVPAQESFPGVERYHELLNLVHAEINITPISGVGSKHWSPQSMYALLGKCGVTNLRFNAWGYGTAPDDERLDVRERQQLRENEYQLQKEWLKELRDSYQTGISREEFDEAIRLTDARFNWLRNNPAYDWEAGVSIVASGIKAR